MYFRIVSKHSNMSHDGDLIRSDLYYTNASKDILYDVLKITKDAKLSVDDSIERAKGILNLFGYEMKRVDCDIVFNLSERE